MRRLNEKKGYDDDGCLLSGAHHGPAIGKPYKCAVSPAGGQYHHLPLTLKALRPSKVKFLRITQLASGRVWT